MPGKLPLAPEVVAKLKQEDADSTLRKPSGAEKGSVLKPSGVPQVRGFSHSLGRVREVQLDRISTHKLTLRREHRERYPDDCSSCSSLSRTVSPCTSPKKPVAELIQDCQDFISPTKPIPECTRERSPSPNTV
jgi:hypothetical protein